MLLTALRYKAVQHIVHVGLLITLLLSLLAPGLPVLAQEPGATNNGDSGGGIVWRVCDPPPTCFASIEARQAWAEQNNCRFLEDICEGTPPDMDDQGAQAEDQGFWGSLWNDIKGALVYGYEFVKGLLAGLKEQISDLFDLITDIDEVVSGLIDLGKAFYEDPGGTLKALAELLGQEAVDAITQSTQCGAYDLGKTIGEYVNPAVMLKLATRLQQYGGKVAEAVQATKHDLGCASFAAGTLVHTPAGMLPIERIAVGQSVLSRHERTFADNAQTVTDVFGRTAPSYRLLQTEFDSLKVTDEHPLWVQGRGWTEARHVTDEDVIASHRGDVLVLRNEAVHQPLRVYNFSVANTPSYFVGEGAVWVHNAKCGIEFYTLAWNKLTPKQKGFRAERDIFVHLNGKGYEPVGNSFDPRGKSPDEAYKAWDGQTGIDGIYKDKDGNYIIVESKATGGEKAADPKGCVDKLCKLTGGERQLSDEWIDKNLKKLVPDKVQRDSILSGLKNGKTKKVYAITDEKGTSYHEVIDVANNPKEVKIGALLGL